MEPAVVLERYRRRADAFEALVAATSDNQWSNQSPCERWDARAVVDHIVTMQDVMLRPLDLTPTDGPSVADDPLGAFRRARADVEALLTDPVLAHQMTSTPAGDLGVADMVNQVASQDLVHHAWDLAKATGQDATMNADDVVELLPVVEALPPEVYIPGAYGPGIEVLGPKVPVPEDASPQDRLLGLLGRDPHWAAP
ncbi:maleylpyruvate isomerase family mycothiol-dependent enzyme [Aeromicrobium panaciterrae]|uniref:TIGR03086 family metal-binding protein n=1 Tax=Aeromicrobium panaciterrae TaxID=363861 RepID=UPI0031E22161